MKMRDRVKDLETRRATYQAMGGPERVEKQRARGKMDVRQRLEKLLDPGSWVEQGLLASDQGLLPENWPRPSPADGVVCGTGKIEGRAVAVAAYDFTVYGGSIGQVGEIKVARLREVALRNRMPMVWLIDSGGARIHSESTFGAGAGAGNAIAQFADTGYLFREEVVMSGVVPLVAAMMGPGAAGTAYIPGLADFVPMVKGTSSIAIGGPYLVKSVVGEDISEEELGGSKVHTKISGVADLELKDDDACLQAIRQYLSYFPSSAGQKPPKKEPRPPPEGWEERLLDVLPDESKKSYDMRKLMADLVDGGELFEIKPNWAKNIVTALARIDGHAVGIVANNPHYLGGILDVNAADKAARFINLCDAFEIPLCFLQDVPGFMVGSKVEQQGIIRHGAKMLYAVATATVPKLTVVVRKGYGAGYYVMCGRAYEPDLIVGWPTAEISVMGAEGMVSIAAHKLLETAENPAEMKAQLADALRPQIDPYRVAAQGLIDDIIDPRETRRVLIRGLEMTANKQVARPYRKREISPV
ncbi:MAG: acyl-CoA carboxylase subunit beta [Deltaproteobacteria bacterium]|jgi:acetyl-CoA carboxylase carboxyltransferase component|nr:acyl-CoA carboxylase subunit beta [Deltaproteobacteria bacterium]